MKKLYYIGMLLVSIVFNIEAQTNQTPNLLPPITPTLDSFLQSGIDVAFNPTNFAFATGGGRSATGNNNLAFADYIYNFNSNAGLVFGYDYLWTSTKGIPPSANVVKGGLSLRAKVYPLKFLGFDTFAVSPLGTMLIATPVSGTKNNGGIGTIAITGFDYEFPPVWKIKFHIDPMYENRTGQGTWDKNYFLLGVAGSIGF